MGAHVRRDGRVHPLQHAQDALRFPEVREVRQADPAQDEGAPEVRDYPKGAASASSSSLKSKTQL